MRWSCFYPEQSISSQCFMNERIENAGESHFAFSRSQQVPFIPAKWLLCCLNQVNLNRGSITITHYYRLSLCVCLRCRFCLCRTQTRAETQWLRRLKFHHWGQKRQGLLSLSLGNPAWLHYLQQIDLKALVYCARESNCHEQLFVW